MEEDTKVGGVLLGPPDEEDTADDRTDWSCVDNQEDE